MTQKLHNQFTTQGFMPSSWEETPDGFLRVKARPLKEGIMPYSRAELQGIPPELDGVDPIMLFVGMDAMSSGETLRSLEGAQVVAPDHIWVTPANTDAVKGAAAGHASVSGPYQEVDLLVTDQATIKAIKLREIGELSGGYHADCVFGEGDWNGQPYHGRQVGIFYNHIAVIPPGTGRAGFEVRILNKKKEEDPMSVKVQLRNTKKFINTDEEGAAAIAEESSATESTEAGSGKKLEELMAEVEALNTQIAELTAQQEESKGELSVYKEKLDEILSDESIEAAADAMNEETGEAAEIIENMACEDDAKKKEEFKNSLKKLHGTKLHTAVLSACGVKVENMSPEALKGAFKAQHQIVNTFKTKKPGVAGAKLMNSMTPVTTTGSASVTRTAAQKLGLKTT